MARKGAAQRADQEPARRLSDDRAFILPAYIRRDKGWLDDAWRVAFVEALDKETADDDEWGAVDKVWREMSEYYYSSLAKDADSVCFELMQLPILPVPGHNSEHMFWEESWKKFYEKADYDLISSSDGTRKAIVFRHVDLPRDGKINKNSELLRQNSDLVSEQDVQNSSDSPSPEAAAPPLRMGETETIQAAAELLSRVYPEKAVTKALQDLAANAAREMTGRATAEPRLKWEKDALPDEDPATFAWRAYQAEAKDGTLHRGLIGQEDEALAVKLANWLRTHKMPEGIDIPTKPEWNTRQLEKLGIAASSNDDPAALATLRLYEVARKRRERVATPG